MAVIAGNPLSVPPRLGVGTRDHTPRFSLSTSGSWLPLMQIRRKPSTMPASHAGFPPREKFLVELGMLPLAEAADACRAVCRAPRVGAAGPDRITVKDTMNLRHERLMTQGLFRRRRTRQTCPFPSHLYWDGMCKRADKSGNLAESHSAISAHRCLDICLTKRWAASLLSIHFARSGPAPHTSSRAWRAKLRIGTQRRSSTPPLRAPGGMLAKHCFQQLLAHTCAHHPAPS